MDTLQFWINEFNERVGRLNSLLVLPLVGVVFFEVLMRYAFNAPTIWGFEVTGFLYGIHYMLGLALTEGRGGHVKVDVLVMRFGPKTQAAINIFTYLVIFMPIWGIMAYAACVYGYDSMMNNEANSTSFAPLIWPYKCLMALGFIMLFLQGISSLLRNVEIFLGLKEG